MTPLLTMCGINGLTGADKPLMRKMDAIIRHRGPDQEGIFADERVTLGSCRLSIIDLSPKGRMPMHNGNETLWIVFNGEIYNYQELRQELAAKGHSFRSKTDTEVILKAYEQWGASCVERLNGEFAFCIYDTIRKTLFLARDRLGIKPLFYLHKGAFAFSSEIKALLLHPAAKREMDWHSLGAYLSFRYVPGEQTIIRDVKKLLPGHTLALDLVSMKKKIVRYWQPSFEQAALGQAEAEQRVLSLLEDSVRRRMVADVPLGAFLSGGIDSTAMVALMMKSGGAVKTFSVGFDEQSFSEVESSRLVAERLGTEHTELTVKVDAAQVLPRVVWHLDDLMADPAAVPTYLMSEVTRKHVKVVLSGDGNDEVFAGYLQYELLSKGAALGAPVPFALRPMLRAAAGAVPVPYIRRAANLALAAEEDRFLAVTSPFTPEEQDELLTEDARVRMAWDARQHVRGFMDEKLPPLHRWLRFDIENWLPDDILVKSDRMSLANSLELRVPYLDHRYVELALSLPPEMKLRGGQEKLLFRRAVRNIVPPEVLARKKHGFAVPINEWLERDLRHSAERVFRVSPILNSGIFRQGSLGRIIREHQLSRRIYKRQFWSLLTLAIWHRLHIEEARTAPETMELDALF